MIVTENEIKQIIETYVIQYLTELGGGQRFGTGNKNVEDDAEINKKLRDKGHKETESDKALRTALRTPGLNKSAVAKQVQAWRGQTKDTNRSLISKISRGIIKPDSVVKNQIKRAISNVGGKLK